MGSGDERAFAALYKRYHQQLYRYCRSLLREEADAQDVLQAAFTGAFTALRRSQRDAPLRPWLYRIAHNEAITVLRRRRGHDELSEASGSVSVSVEETVAGTERFAALMADLRELPERQRAALVMRELSGLSHEDIALALRISVGAAKQTIFEARRSLQEFAAGRAMGCEEICRIVSDGDRRALRGRRVRAHLRDCSGCSAFATAIPARRAHLNAIAPPLAPIAAGGMLATLLGHAGARSAGAGPAAGLAGKSAGLAIATKAMVGVVIVAGAGAGLGTALTHRDGAAPAAAGRRVHGPSHAQGTAPTVPGARPVGRSRHGGSARSTTGRRPGVRAVSGSGRAPAGRYAAAAQGAGRRALAHSRGTGSANTAGRHESARGTNRAGSHGRRGLETNESHRNHPAGGSPREGAPPVPAPARQPATPRASAEVLHTNPAAPSKGPDLR
ncbi:MAG TPA: sigma-70 family RNA polymerase sigma factor [Solirubrobacteraceae bacterium]|nr:sigma-70 family RNA polymerase sigma factor [Solirubrobacteraceae bacterium]